MSKIENYDLAYYNSIEDALRKLMSPYKCDQPEEILACTYTHEAYKQAMAFFV